MKNNYFLLSITKYTINIIGDSTTPKTISITVDTNIATNNEISKKQNNTISSVSIKKSFIKLKK
jgi:hypothetical protein